MLFLQIIGGIIAWIAGMYILNLFYGKKKDRY